MDITDLKTKLANIANVEICKEGYVFTVLLTGEGLQKSGTVIGIQNLILEYAGGKYPTIETMRNNETYFCIVLRPNGA